MKCKKIDIILSAMRGNIYAMCLWRLLVVMAIFSTMRILFYLFNHSFFEEIPLDHFVVLMQSGLRFDLTATLYTNVLFVILSIIPLPFKYTSLTYQQMLKGIYMATNAIALFVNTVDFPYFRYTLRRTDFSFFSEFANDGNLLSVFLKGCVDYWYLVILYLLLLVALWFLYGKVRKSEPMLKGWRFYAVSTLLMCASLGLMVAGVRGGFAYSIRPITLSNAGEKVNKPIETAIVLNTPFSIYLSSGAQSFEPIGFMEAAEAEQFCPPIHNVVATEGHFKKKNVVVIILESFSKEFSGFLNNYTLDGRPYKGYTPFLDSLAQQGLAWRNGFANGQKSIDAIPSILGSVPSLVQPFVISKYALNNMKGLGSILQDEGYHTSFFHGAINGSMGFDAASNMLGFTHYFGKTEYANNADYDGIWGIWDEEFLQFFASELSGFPQPFASAVFTISSHHPYQVPLRYKDVFPKGEQPLHQCLGYSDHALKQFFEKASQTEWYNNTLFVITADHSLPSDLHPRYKSPAGVFAVPVIFYTPNGEIPPTLSDAVIQQIDIMPSVLGHLRYTKPYFAFGQDFFNKEEPRFAVNYLNGFYQLIEEGVFIKFDGKDRFEYYDYDKDPLLVNQLTKEQIEPDRRVRLENRMKAFIQTYINRLIEDRMLP